MNTNKSLDFTFIEQLLIILISSCCFVGGIFFGRQIEKEAIRKEADLS